jgi:hypothetical protein
MIYDYWLPVGICKLLGHKWRDISQLDYDCKDGIKFVRTIHQRHCDRCGADEIIGYTPWEEEKRDALAPKESEPRTGSQ